ncbi:MAG TPA: hypothetical protein VK783_01805 [Bacteroidia bacterium]|nr:hypothetical protein [Bacteroidia bacterium]
MKQKTSFIVQARSTSTRLPGKVLIPFYHTETILDIQLNNLKNRFPGIPIIIATTDNRADDLLANKYSENFTVFRGDENNVLKRFIDAAKQYSVENIVRICSDNPFLSMTHLSALIDSYFKTLPDYITYRFKNGTPAMKSHVGLFAEMVSLKALEAVKQSTFDKLYTEHVTNYIYSNPEKFRLEFLQVPLILEPFVDKLRLTIDTKEDFASIQKLYLAVLKKGSDYTLEEIIAQVEADNGLLKEMIGQIEKYAK